MPESLPLVCGARLSEPATEAPPAPSGGTTACRILGEARGRLSCRACKRMLPLPPPLLSDAAELWALSACLSAASGVDAPCKLLVGVPCDQRG